MTSDQTPTPGKLTRAELRNKQKVSHMVSVWDKQTQKVVRLGGTTYGAQEDGSIRRLDVKRYSGKSERKALKKKRQRERAEAQAKAA